jgi:hypoxanthine phosphoribosyltransferase
MTTMSIEKKYYDYIHVHEWIQKIVLQMYKDNWRPDYIVGLTRGGLIPAVIMSHMLDISMHPLSVSLRDSEIGPESNCWIAEDAFNGKNILILDDINDTGATLDWIIQDWQSGCHPSDAQWKNVWGNNVRFAVCVDNLSSKFSRCVNYCANTINKAEQDVWIVFPWER